MMQGYTSSPLTSLSPLLFRSEWVDWLFSDANRVWIGFSGGVDSHVLLHSLVTCLSSEQKRKLSVLHVHHGLSHNANEWLHHCEAICDELGVVFTAKKVLVAKQASLEEAARNARYEAFRQVMGEQDVLLLAHHAEDQVETVLFRLLRGTGGKGLAGMPQVRSLGKASIIRPFLSVSKNEIEAYARLHQLIPIHDESNLDERFTRNFLRHRVVPILRERFPALEQTINTATRRISTDYQMLEQLASQQLSHWVNQWGGLELIHLRDKALEERLFWWRHFLQGRGVSLTSAQFETLDTMFFSAEDKQPEFVFAQGRIMRHQKVAYLLPQDQPVVLSSLTSNQLLERSFDEIRVSGVAACELRERPLGEILLLPNGKTRPLKKWLNDQGIPSWWRDHLPYVYVDGLLVAIGNLWLHPNFYHLSVAWQPDSQLPFPNK